MAIARAVFFGARVLILDEPTAALGVKQSGVVLRYITAAKEQGFGVIFITHNPHHAHMVGDHFVLLNRGRQKLDCTYDEITLEHLTQEMAGGNELEALPTSSAASRSRPRTPSAAQRAGSCHVRRRCRWASRCVRSATAADSISYCAEGGEFGETTTLSAI